LAYIPLSVLGTRPDIGSYPLTVRAVLSNGDQSKHDTTVELLDTPPDVVLTVVQNAVNGGPFVVELDIILAGDDTLTTADIDWRDGSFDSIQAGQTPISHEYAQDGTYLITVDVFDSDGQYTLGPFEVRETSVDPFTQNIPSPAPLYNELMKQLARKQMRKFADAVTINTTIRGQATIDGFNKGQIIVPTTSLQPYGFDLAAAQNWQTRETGRLNRAGYDVTFDWKAYLHYDIIGGHVPPGTSGPPTGLVQYRFFVYITATTTNRATGQVKVTRKKVWQTEVNSGYDDTWADPAKLKPNPNIPSLPRDIP
jgi:hypothetical protein